MGVTAQQLFPSPLRYPGGKRKLSGFIKLLMLGNGLVGREYVEPYAGGASVALSLLYEDYASHIHINDLNRSVFAFWAEVLADPESLCRRVREVAVTVEEWHRQRAVQSKSGASRADLAFSTLFLNRTSRSGIIGGGVIGGLKQTGKWKIDARFNRADLVRRIQKVARHRTRITLSQLDAAEYISESLPAIADAFVYLDPPYFTKGEGLYQNFYEGSDHAEIAALVKGISQPWVVSYDAAPEILRLYESHASLAYGLRYSAQERYEGTEVMFFHPDLQAPDVESPANIPSRLVDERRLNRQLLS
jgi:DNA adenine methylase